MEKCSVIHKITKITVDVMFFGGIIATIGVLWYYRWLVKWMGQVDRGNPTDPVILMVLGALAVFTLFQLRKMFQTLLGGNPFVMENVMCFRKMAVACSLIVVVTFLKLWLEFTFPALVILFVFVMITLFCLTLKDLFKQAVAYKEENDWTV